MKRGYFSKFGRFARYRFSDESAKVFNDVFFFGDVQKNIFEKNFGAHESFIVSGNQEQICGSQIATIFITL